MHDVNLVIRYSFLLFGSVMLIMTSMPISFAQVDSIAAPLSDGNAPNIDGFWTNSSEWTQSGGMLVNYTDDTQLFIHTKHDANFLYILLEMPGDRLVDGHGVVCIDAENDGGLSMSTDDYCFTQGTSLRIYRGDNRTTTMRTEVAVFGSVQAARGLTTSYHSTDEHVSYEFKIPLEEYGAIGNEFGMYVTFDTRGRTDSYTHLYSWPDVKTNSYLDAPPPKSWAKITLFPSTDVPEPQVSVPEFPVSAISGIAAVASLVAILTQTSLLRKVRY